MTTRADLPYWPGSLKRADAARYCSLSVAAFEAEVASGRLPMPFLLGGSEHWNRNRLQAALDALDNGEPDWFTGSPLFDAA